MQLSRRNFQRIVLGLTTLPFAATFARAEDYPTRPVRLICGFPAGSGPDIVARIIAQGMSGRLGQSVVVENRPGAGSNLATADLRTPGLIACALSVVALLGVLPGTGGLTRLVDKRNVRRDLRSLFGRRIPRLSW